MTSVLVHTSSREATNALRIARVAAAGRITDARHLAEAAQNAREASLREDAQVWADETIAAGAVRFGFKVTMSEGGKWRPVLDADDDIAGFIARQMTWEDDVEAWGIAADGSYVGTTY